MHIERTFVVYRRGGLLYLCVYIDLYLGGNYGRKVYFRKD